MGGCKLFLGVHRSVIICKVLACFLVMLISLAGSRRRYKFELSVDSRPDVDLRRRLGLERKLCGSQENELSPQENNLQTR